MDIGNNDIDFIEDEYTSEIDDLEYSQDMDVDLQEEEQLEPYILPDFVTDLLQSRGISDPSRIKFENENGEIEETDWNSLDEQSKINIIHSAEIDDNTALDEAEILLINAIRLSLLTPAEYILGIQRLSVNNYITNAAYQNLTYSTDQYSDEELYVMDLLSKSSDITNEEAIEALERAKADPTLFSKQAKAIRSDYLNLESQHIQGQQIQEQQFRLNQYNQFADSIENAIINFKEFSGCELNMDREDMEDLYTFITGFDNAGNSWLGKAINDPETLVLMAWFALYGDSMIRDMQNYYNNEITSVRKQSYEKGLKDAGDKSIMTYKPKGRSFQDGDDLDNY